MSLKSRLMERLPGEDISDALAEELLEGSKAVILAHRYSNSTYPSDATIPPVWEQNQLEIAIRLFGQMGAEGQQSHSENGISRNWDAGGGITFWLSMIPTVSRVVRGN